MGEPPRSHPERIYIMVFIIMGPRFPLVMDFSNCIEDFVFVLLQRDHRMIGNILECVSHFFGDKRIIVWECNFLSHITCTLKI